MSNHLTENRLDEYVMGRMTNVEIVHLNTCSGCRKRLKEAWIFTRAMKSAGARLQASAPVEVQERKGSMKTYVITFEAKLGDGQDPRLRMDDLLCEFDEGRASSEEGIRLMGIETLVPSPASSPALPVEKPHTQATAAGLTPAPSSTLVGWVAGNGSDWKVFADTTARYHSNLTPSQAGYASVADLLDGFPSGFVFRPVEEVGEEITLEHAAFAEEPLGAPTGYAGLFDQPVPKDVYDLPPTYDYKEIAAGMFLAHASYIVVKDTLCNLECGPLEADRIIAEMEVKEGYQFGKWPKA